MVAKLGPAHRDPADPGLDLALARVAVPDHAALIARILEVRMRAEKSLDRGLDHLLQHPPGPRPQNLE